MISSKKAIEMSLNVVVVAVLVLLVLLVLSIIFLGGAQNWFKGTSCDSHGGSCGPSPCAPGSSNSPWSCDVKTEVCCTPLIGK